MIRNRLHLWVFLTRNPSLCKDRISIVPESTNDSDCSDGDEGSLAVDLEQPEAAIEREEEEQKQNGKQSSDQLFSERQLSSHGERQQRQHGKYERVKICDQLILFTNKTP